MIRGLYTAASGMMVEAARQETITNNLANSETTGFKRDLALQRAHAEQPVVREGNNNRFQARPIIGTLGLGSLVDGIHTAHEQGGLQETSRSLDLAITGSGFFTVDTAEGPRYTRSGAFTLDADRYLVNDQGYRVLGTTGLLRIPEGEMSVDGSGQIFVDGQLQGQLRLSAFEDPLQLRKQGESLYATGDGQMEIPADGVVKQGFLETSNVQAVQEMVRMIATLRAYETNQRAVQAQDELLGKAVNEVGSLR